VYRASKILESRDKVIYWVKENSFCLNWKRFLEWSIVIEICALWRSAVNRYRCRQQKIRIVSIDLLQTSNALSYRRIPSRSLFFGPCRMISARLSAEGLKITIDADLLPRYLVPRDSRKSLVYIPARQCHRIDLPLCVLQCNGSQNDASYLSTTYFVKSRNVRPALTFLATLHKNTLLDSIREDYALLMKKDDKIHETLEVIQYHSYQLY